MTLGLTPDIRAKGEGRRRGGEGEEKRRRSRLTQSLSCVDCGGGENPGGRGLDIDQRTVGGDVRQVDGASLRH